MDTRTKRASESTRHERVRRKLMKRIEETCDRLKIGPHEKATLLAEIPKVFKRGRPRKLPRDESNSDLHVLADTYRWAMKDGTRIHTVLRKLVPIAQECGVLSEQMEPEWHVRRLYDIHKRYGGKTFEIGDDN
jgi:hypothetical protein